MKLPKEGTTLYKVFMIMERCKKEQKTIEIKNLRNKFGEPVNRSIVSMYVHKLNNEQFDVVKFHTRTIDGKLYIGISEV